VSVIALIVDGTTDELGSLAGKLGMVKGVQVCSSLIRKIRGPDQKDGKEG